MEDNSNYTVTYEKTNEEPEKPERSLKLIFAIVIVVLAVLAIVLGIVFGSRSPETGSSATTEPGSSEVVTTSPSQNSDYKTGKYKVNADGKALCFRKDHSREAEAILEIPDGTALEITDVYFDETAQSEDFKYWGQTEYYGHTGWVAMKYLKKAYSDNIVTPEETSVEETSTAAPATAATEPASEIILPKPEENTSGEVATKQQSSQYSAGNYVVSTGGSTLTLRAGAGTNNNAIMSIADGEKLTITEVVDTGASNSGTRYWGKVNYNGSAGYVCMTYLKSAN